MDSTKQLLVMLAKLMSKEQCIERLQESINEYKEALLSGSDKEVEKTQDHIMMSCHLLILNNMDMKAEDIIQDMKDVEQRVNFFKTDKN
jgi:hypothetical protein